jgi:hypothetical protein
MDQSEDPRELERKINHASRIASRINDQTTVERLRAWIEELERSPITFSTSLTASVSVAAMKRAGYPQSYGADVSSKLNALPL